VVNCFRKWDSLRDDLFFKNAAFYKAKGGNHCITIAVSKTSIQLQVFTLDKDIVLEEKETKYIRSVVEDLINEITTTFHEQVDCEKGFPCTDISITDEDEGMFLPEEEVALLETNKRPCLIHFEGTKRHHIDRDSFLKYWYKVGISGIPKSFSPIVSLEKIFVTLQKIKLTIYS
jgi:hypothetical protein